MQTVNISTEQLSCSPKALAQSAAKAVAQQTLFGDLPLPARVLLAVPRVRGPLPKAGLVECYQAAHTHSTFWQHQYTSIATTYSASCSTRNANSC